MWRYANVVAVIVLLSCLQRSLEARNVKTQLEIEDRQLLNVLPSWLERLRNNLPSSLTGRVKPLVLFDLNLWKMIFMSTYCLFVFYYRVCHRMSRNRPKF
jgi:hypothetical protein